MSDGTEHAKANPSNESPDLPRSDSEAPPAAAALTVPSLLQSSELGGTRGNVPDRAEEFDVTHTRHPDPAIAPASSPDAPSDTVPQVRSPARYRVLGEHGRGGLGKVSRVRDRELGRDVAVKELLSRGALHEVRFLREALITARLEHPAIVPVHEAGRWPDGTPFYTMKLVAGRPLRDLLARCKTVDDRLALLHHVIAVTDAIAYAHGRNIIHRDLKPSNVIVGDFGETVVIDWGLAKDLSSSEESVRGDGPLPSSRDDDLTSAGTVMGTPAYMAPEQQRGEPVDQRADVYAIGAMLWELCSIEKLPPGYSGQRRRILRASGIDPDLIVIVDKALDADPERRYPDARALAADLKAFKTGARIGARRYSPWGMLVHWTRRHRALALSVTAMIVLAAAGGALYVRNIAAERDRADGALIRSQLSEASLLLEKDPTRAKELLVALPTRSPRHAYLTSMARQLAATRVITFPIAIEGIFRGPNATTIELLTRDGGLHRIHPANGLTQRIDNNVRVIHGKISYRERQPIYPREASSISAVHIASPSSSNLFNIELSAISFLTVLNDAVYALDTGGNLHRLTDNSATIVDRGIGNLVGAGDIRIMCKTNHDLEVIQHNDVVFHNRCPEIKSPASMAAVDNGWVVITEERKLVTTRQGRRLSLQTSINGEYELAMSNTTMIAIADYGTNLSWFIRADSEILNAGPVYASQLYGVAADGTLAAWGYSDGTMVAFDTKTGMTWKLRGHPDGVALMTVDAVNARLVAAVGRDIRIWELKQPEFSHVATMPCVNYQIEPSPDGRLVASDCNDGAVRVWSRDTGVVRTVHVHTGEAYGLQWINGKICSGGRNDGHILCSNADGSDLEVIDSGAIRITWLASDPKHNLLFFSSDNGHVVSYNRNVDILYTQRNANRLATSDDGHYLASSSLDGSLTVYDLINHRIIDHAQDHTGATYDLTWRNHEIWTAGEDAIIQRWAVQNDRLTLQSSIRASGPVRRCARVNGGWAISAGDSIQVIRIDGTVALHLEVGKTVSALEVSPDRRYIAAVAGGAITVIDILNSAIATLIIDIPEPRKLRFLGPTTLEFSQVFLLNVTEIDKLEYVRFEPPLSL